MHMQSPSDAPAPQPSLPRPRSLKPAIGMSPKTSCVNPRWERVDEGRLSEALRSVRACPVLR
jgi:hypothetical protein